MHDLSFVWLCLTALIAGAVNSMAGGGTLLTFPALIAVLTPLPLVGGPAAAAVYANATSTVALLPGSMAGAWGYRRKLREARRWLLLLVGPSLLGGIIGSLLVTRLNPAYFAMLVPWLILTATSLLLGDSLLRSRIVRPAANAMPRDPAAVPAPPAPAPTSDDATGTGAGETPARQSSRSTGLVMTSLILFQLGVAIYGGYFGAGIGILMLSALAMMGIGDINRMNAVKTVLNCCINGISVVVFVVEDRVFWRYALPMAAIAIVGGYLGAVVALRIRPRIVRWIVIVIGFTLASYYFYRQHAGSSGQPDSKPAALSRAVTRAVTPAVND